MPDIEKVIKGLEWCMNEKHDCYREKGCPYENEGEDIGCKYALHSDALALLKAQDAKLVHVTAKINYRKIGECPTCGNLINSGYYPNYCGVCGQAVKWE